MDATTQNPQISAADAAQIANIHSGTLNLGPVTINWNLDITLPRLIADISLHGVSLGHVVLDTANPTATIGGNIGFAEAEVTLTADFTKKQIDYQAIVKAFGIQILNKSGVLLTW